MQALSAQCLNPNSMGRTVALASELVECLKKKHVKIELKPNLFFECVVI